MAGVIGFDEALKRVGADSCSLLLGNGFSAKYCAYSTLLEKAGLPDDAPRRKLFDHLGTSNFERVVRALEDAAEVEEVYGDEAEAERLKGDAVAVREALVQAVRAAHPKHRNELLREIGVCIEFLTPFKRIFTTNYDLLLYWVIIGSNRFGDGFLRASTSEGFRGPFKEDARCNVYNLHGGLHLFLRDDNELEKRVAGADGGLDAIAQTIAEERFPVYVAEGTSQSKQRRILATPYLKLCHDRLNESSGSFFVFGHSADETDAHIYDALFKSRINQLYFCVYDQGMLNELDGRLAKYQKSNGSKIPYTFVDSKSAGVWE